MSAESAIQMIRDGITMIDAWTHADFEVETAADRRLIAQMKLVRQMLLTILEEAEKP